MIDEKELIQLIKDHKETVKCDYKPYNEVYGLAHDHIISIVEILAKNTNQNGDGGNGNKTNR